MSDVEREQEQPQSEPEQPFDEQSEEGRAAEAPWGTQDEPHEGEEGQDIV